VQIVGHNIVWLDEISSTNDYCIDLCKSQLASEGLVVAAKSQMKGKGQRGSNWEAEKDKNLTFSICLFPKLAVENQFILNKIASLSVCDFLNKLDIESQIKWPNDILVQNRKISGILIENGIQGKEIIYSVLGIGLNVNQNSFEGFNATSILNLKGKEMDLKVLLEQYLKSFQYYYLLLQSKMFNKIENDYYSLLYAYKQMNKFEDSQGIFVGMIEGVDKHGALIVSSDSREKKIYQLKDIKIHY
jgi:BirA family biotin operon repressor/biotin-[acetyl-CoA-carboxylase] ligase